MMHCGALVDHVLLEGCNNAPFAWVMQVAVLVVRGHKLVYVTNCTVCWCKHWSTLWRVT